MSKSKDPYISFIPRIPCPHCNASVHVAISGWGGVYNTRVKSCKKCGKDFHLEILVNPVKVDKAVSDGEQAELRGRMRFLRERRKETHAQNLIKYEVAQKMYEESLAEAVKQREKFQNN